MDTTVTSRPSATDISEGLGQAVAMAEAGQLGEALVVVQGLQAALDDAGLASAHVHVALAALHSARGEMEKALIQATTATELEPNNPGCEMAFDHVVEKADGLLVTAYPWNERGLLLFKMLASTGLATDEVLALVTGAPGTESKSACGDQ